MILKNEARTIGPTLASVRACVDRWCILDTGSTDGTQQVVREAFRDIPGDLFEEPFVDFATSRNRALDLCGTATPFILWLDADDVLEGGEALRSFLAGEVPRRTADREAFYLRIQMREASFDSARVVESRAGWRFRGVVHEVLMHPDRPPPAHRIPNVTIRHFVDDQAAERSRARWTRDVHLLEREVAKNPGASREAFYLAMTLLWLGRNEEAIAAFDRRIALGGWQEEVFYAKLSKARAANRARRPWGEVLPMYLDAHGAAPHRAEPLLDVAMHYDAEQNHALAFLFARRAYELPFPADTLFVEVDAYAWKAADLVGTHGYWLGEYTLGEQAAQKAAHARPADARLARNLQFYRERK
jgi:glycosyltransferase involved in cell wall biosynthesis